MSTLSSFLRRFNIKNRLLLFLLPALVFSLGCTIIFSRTVAQALLKNYFYNYIKSTQKEISSSVEMIIDEINILATRLTINNEIYKLFNESGFSPETRETELGRILDRLLVHKDIVGAVYIVNLENEVYEYAPSGLPVQKPDLLDIDRAKDSALPAWGTIKRDQNNNSYIVFCRNYHNFYTGETLGYLFVYIRESALYDVYGKIVPEGSYSFIIADGERIISHPDKEQVGAVLFDKDIFAVNTPFSYKRMPYNGEPVILASSQFSNRLKSLGINWSIVSIIAEAKLFQIIVQMNRIVMVIGLTILVTAVFLAVYISYNITKPVARLKDKLDLFGKDNIKAVLSGPPKDEIAVLEKSYDEMVLRIQDLLAKNNMEREKQRELELIALQAQINPHFIYNTLDAIGWMAKLKNQPEIERLVISLATFFRISLRKGDKFITVEEEVRLVQSFVTIEQVRFPGQFEVTYQIPAEIKGYYMLKIILQPLVENAVKHGVSLKKGLGHIRIRGRKEGSDLLFEVIDDGVGFEMNSEDFNTSYQKIKYSGYGLRNVDERIKLECGPEYGLSVHSEKNKGTTVTVRVKAVVKKEG